MFTEEEQRLADQIEQAERERDNFKAAWQECERIRHATQQQRNAAEQERDELYARLEARDDPQFFADVFQLVAAVQSEPGCVYERDAADRVMKRIQEWGV